MTWRRIGSIPAWQVHAAGVALVAMILALVVLIGVLPLVGAHARERALREKYQEQWSMLALDRASESSLSASLAEAKSELSEVQISLRGAGQINARIGDLAELARRTGLTLTEVKPGAGHDRTGYVAIPILVGGRGGFIETVGFVRSLAESFPDMGIDSFHLTGDLSGADGGPRFELDLTWYAGSAGSAGHAGEP